MWRHHGKGRTYSHNLRLASLLSSVAGMVNIIGLLSVDTLTTNVTGHFAYFAENIFFKDYQSAFIYIIYIVSFLLGAFISGLTTLLLSKNKKHLLYIVPLTIEITILICVALFFPQISHQKFTYNILIASMLLFAMGLQKALVTKISQSVVRTTHLTGLFTDLGLDLSQLLITKGQIEDNKLRKNIYLKLLIIISFFVGGVTGAFFYKFFEIKSLILPAIFVLLTSLYDHILYRFYSLKRKKRHI